MESFSTVEAAALGVLTVCVVAVFVAYAAGRFSQDGGQARASCREGRNPATRGFAGAEISMDRAEEAALGEVSGDVLDAWLDDENGVPVYRVDVLEDNCSLHRVNVDAKSGDVLSHTTED
jgi:uncharacterized membrane protein YkoI